MSLPKLAIVALGNIDIAFREQGTGPALVLIHGLGGQSESWSAQFDAFSDRYRVIAWDGPGYGQSADFPLVSPTVGDYADLLLEFFDAARIVSAHLVGHSFGGIIIAAFNRRFPERVSSLTFLESVVGSGKLARAEQVRLCDARRAQMETLSPGEFATFRARRALGPHASSELAMRVARVSYEVRPRGHLQAFGAMCGAYIFDELAGIECPSLVVSGEFDATASPDGCRAIAEAIPGAELCVIAGVGHVAYMEAPEELNARLAEFLANRSPASSE